MALKLAYAFLGVGGVVLRSLCRLVRKKNFRWQRLELSGVSRMCRHKSEALNWHQRNLFNTKENAFKTIYCPKNIVYFEQDK